MKNFLKYILASIIGGLITLLLFTFFFFILISSVSTGFKKEKKIEKGPVLEITLSSPVNDKSENSFNFNFSGLEKSLCLGDLLSSISKAKEDDNIKGIFLNLEDMQTGMANLEEIRNKLIEFKESGKFIVSYSSIYSQGSYYLASISDHIYINPQGDLDWKGLYANVLYFKRALDKFGIEAQIFRYGQFKSAVEPFFTDRMSDASKLQTITLLNSIWDNMCKNISSQRGISIEDLNLFADEIAITSAQLAVKKGFVDECLYYDEVLHELKTLAEIDLKTKEDKLITKLANYHNHKTIVTKSKEKDNMLAVIFAEGEIVDGDKAHKKIAGDWMANIIREVRENDKIKAVVLRINSPGGSGLASEIMWRELNLLREVKPLVVSMGNVAASGGYYIACPANHIYALPNTITGSIGVFGMIPNLKKIMTETVGITMDGVGTNKNSEQFSILRPCTQKESENIQNRINEFYDVFLTRVAEGRKISKANVDSIGQGRIWSGLNALEIGLVDEIGGINDAISKAVELAEMDKNNYSIIEYPQTLNLFDEILKESISNMSLNVVEKAMGEEYLKSKEFINYVKQLKGVQARMEYSLDIQ